MFGCALIRAERKKGGKRCFSASGHTWAKAAAWQLVCRYGRGKIISYREIPTGIKRTPSNYVQYFFHDAKQLSHVWTLALALCDPSSALFSPPPPPPGTLIHLSLSSSLSSFFSVRHRRTKVSLPRRMVQKHAGRITIDRKTVSNQHGALAKVSFV